MHIVRDAQYPSGSNEIEPGVPFTLYLDRHFQLSSEHQAFYHEFFVHYPIALLASTGVRSPTNVLVLGGGDGLAAAELLRYPQISAITQVELDPEMLKLATTNAALLVLNQNALSDPRVTVIMDDAFSFLKKGGQQYDAIFIDFPYPFTYDMSRLYSREFYTFVKRSLTPGGFVVADMPLIPKINENQEARVVNDIISSTLRAAGFELEALFKSGINHLGPADFELQNNPGLVNSVFRPTLLSLRNRGL
jgi:spermidine synthase